MFAGDPTQCYSYPPYVYTNKGSTTSSVTGSCSSLVDNFYCVGGGWSENRDYSGVHATTGDNCAGTLTVTSYQSTGMCPTGTVKASAACLTTCPDGSFLSSSNICKVCPSNSVYDYASDTCIAPQSCPFSIVKGQCINLAPYDSNPYQCIKHGGIPTGSFQGSGVPFWKTGFSIKWVSKCYDKTGAINGVIPLIAGVTGNISGKPDLLGILLQKGIDKVKGIWSNLFNNSSHIPDDYLISLPKYNPETKTYEPEIVTNPIPKGDDGLTPSRAPDLQYDPYNSFLRNEYFPSNNLDPNGNPVIDMATADRFNKTNEIYNDNAVDPVSYTYTPNLANIWKSTSGVQSTEPVLDGLKMVTNPSYAPKMTYEAPTFRVAPPDSTFYPPVPVKVADIPVKSTSSNAVVMDRPVKQWINDRNYPDGSYSRETITIDEASKVGNRVTTVVSNNGFSSTTTENFALPNYVSGSTSPEAYEIYKTSPVTSGSTPIQYGTITTTPVIDPITGYPSTSSTVSSSLPSTQVAYDLLNAPMPSYNVPQTGDFIPFDSNPITEMIESASEMFSNIEDQISSTKTVFDNTKLMLEGGWTPPVIPSGSCGDSMAFDFHGRHIDLCPPLVNSTAVASPIVSSVVTIGGMAFAVVIFIGGF